MHYMCGKCGAKVWFEERAEKSPNRNKLEFSICCMKGKVLLPHIRKPPALLWNLIHGVHDKSDHFLGNIRLYNNMFSFTSLGGVVNTSSNDGGGPPQFCLSGQNYHRIGTLLPVDGSMPQFAQLYIYDTKNEVSNRMKHFR